MAKEDDELAALFVAALEQQNKPDKRPAKKASGPAAPTPSRPSKPATPADSSEMPTPPSGSPAVRPSTTPPPASGAAGRSATGIRGGTPNFGTAKKTGPIDTPTPSPRPSLEAAKSAERPATGPTPSRPPPPRAEERTPPPERRPSMPPIRGAAVSVSSEIPLGPDGEPLIDHKGRSKPLYKPRRPKPVVWKPSKGLNLLLGVFPGARLAAHEQVSLGLVHATLGAFALIAAVLALTAIPGGRAQAESLLVARGWTLLNPAVVVVALVVFEALRLHSANPRGEPSISRRVAAMTLPALALFVLTPWFVAVLPSLEVLWLASVPVLLIVAAAAIQSAIELDAPTESRRFLAWGVIGLSAVTIVTIAVLALHGTAASLLGAKGQAAGFRLVPQILSIFS